MFINTSGVHKSNPVLLLTKKDKKLLSLGIQKKYKNPATSGKKREFSRAVVSYWLYNLARATVACIFKSLPSGHRRRSYRAQSDASPKTFMNPRGDLSGLKRGVHLREIIWLFQRPPEPGQGLTDSISSRRIERITSSGMDPDSVSLLYPICLKWKCLASTFRALYLVS